MFGPSIYSRLLYPKVVYPLYHFARRDGANRARRELNASQWLDGTALRSLTAHKLQRLLVFAYRNVPYYRDVIRSSGISEDKLSDPDALQRLPELTKDIIRAQENRLIATDLTDNQLIANSTSGSTGEPMRFHHDVRSNAYRKASEIRGKEMSGFHSGEREVKLWGSPIDASSALSPLGRLHGIISNLRFLSAYELTPGRMDEYIETMKKFRPVLVVSYPSALETFANHCRDRDVRFDSIRGIISSAETLYPYQRQLFESQFKAKVFVRYGCREVGEIASECTAHRGLHVSSDRVLMEIVDQQGRPCEPGHAGHVLVTDLDNYGMPFIRYRIGDTAAWSRETTCPCGRNLSLVANVEGRSMDAVKGPNGNSIGGTFWTILFRERPGIKQFQVVQSDPGGVNVTFVRGEGFEAEALDFFAQTIRDKCGEQFAVDFNEVAEIRNSNSGKRRLVISTCS